MLAVFNWALNLLLNTPIQIIVFVLGAAGVSLLSQGFKKWLKIENERWMFLVVMAIAGLGSLLDWFLTAQNLPLKIVGIQTSLLIGVAQPIYFYVVKPLTMIISGYKANKTAIEAKLNEISTTPVPTVAQVTETLTPTAPVAAPAVTINPITIDSPESAAQLLSALTPETTTPVAAPVIAPVEPPRPVASF